MKAAKAYVMSLPFTPSTDFQRKLELAFLAGKLYMDEQEFDFAEWILHEGWRPEGGMWCPRSDKGFKLTTAALFRRYEESVAKQKEVQSKNGKKKR